MMRFLVVLPIIFLIVPPSLGQVFVPPAPAQRRPPAHELRNFKEQALLLPLSAARLGRSPAGWKFRRLISPLAPRDLIPAKFPPYSNAENIRWQFSFPAYLKQHVRAVRRGQAYAGFSPADIAVFMRLSGVTAENHRIYDVQTQGFRQLFLPDLKLYASDQRFILRRGMEIPGTLEWIPQVPGDAVAILDASGLHLTGANHHKLAKAVYDALKALKFTPLKLIESLNRDAIDNLTFYFDTELDVPEESFIPSGKGPATVLLNPRLLEPGFEHALTGAVLKGFLNANNKVKLEEKEAITLPLLFVHWVKLIGISGVMAALKLVGGEYGSPLSDLFSTIILRSQMTRLGTPVYRWPSPEEESAWLDGWFGSQPSGKVHAMVAKMLDKLGTEVTMSDGRRRDLFPLKMRPPHRSVLSAA